MTGRAEGVRRRWRLDVQPELEAALDGKDMREVVAPKVLLGYAAVRRTVEGARVNM